MKRKLFETLVQQWNLNRMCSNSSMCSLNSILTNIQNHQGPTQLLSFASIRRQRWPIAGNFILLNKKLDEHQKYDRFINKTRLFTSSIMTQHDTTANKAGNGSASLDNKQKTFDSSFVARQFISTLTPDERAILKDELILIENELETIKKTTSTPEKVEWKQLFSVVLQTGLPFVGFGFVDNFIMIVAGDMIETYIGMFLPISTMAAAGLGNAISDVGGIGLAHNIEAVCSKIIDAPKLTAEQWSLPIVHWFAVISKSLGIFIGCLIGMTPLLFIHHEDKDKNKNEKEEIK